METTQLLNRQFLLMRAKLLELAADLDRLDRASGDLGDDPRLQQLHSAIETLLDAKPQRAERIQQIFSRDYDPHWRESFGIAPSN